MAELYGDGVAKALTAEMIRKAVEKLKAAGELTKIMPNGQWVAYDELQLEVNPTTPQLENKDIPMDQKFKAIDEKIKKEWGK